MVKNVKVPAAFFVKTAKRDYNSPIHALVREFLQNSVDAKSSKVDFVVAQDGEHITLTCQDNGRGMTREVIQDKLFSLGESDKEDGASTGGFGVAKILLYFAHDEYTIETGKLRVEGSGGTYTIAENNGHHRQGVSATVRLNPEVVGFGYTTQQIEAAVRLEVSRSYLPKVDIRLNGDQLLAEAKKGRKCMENEYMTFHKRKIKGKTDFASIRVNGLHMFQYYVGGMDFELMVELKGYSTELLTSNRDSFRGQARSDVDRTIREICFNPMAGSKTNTEIYRGATAWVSPVTAKVLKQIKKTMASVPGEFKIGRGIIEAAVKNTDMTPVVREQVVAALHTKVIESSNPDTFWDDLTLEDLPVVFAHHIFIKTIGNYRKIPKKWEPANIDLKTLNLLDLWGKIVGMVLQDAGHEKQVYNCGFVLDDGTVNNGVAVAAYERHDETEVFYLNPKGYLGEKPYPGLDGKRRTEVVMTLVALALHEVTHYLGERYHDSSFLAKEEMLRGKVYTRIEKYLAL